MAHNARKLAVVRLIHTIIYVVMAASTFVLLYAGISGQSGPWLFIAIGLLAIEVVVFVGNGFKCPLTALAVRYGAVRGYAFDTYLPESIMRHTFWFFTSLMVLGLVLLAFRWGGILV
jgi:hypothetical protein